jgi:hypothetical protein
MIEESNIENIPLSPENIPSPQINNQDPIVQPPSPVTGEVVKKTSGRPVGSKSSKKISMSDIRKAEVLFTAGKSIPDIQKELGFSSANTLYRWMEKENWMAKRDEYFSASAKRHLDSIVTSQLADLEKKTNELKLIQDTAIDSIKTGKVSPKKFGEATDSYSEAVELERKIKTEGFQLSFVMEVSKILKEEIKDVDTLSRIGSRLRTLFKAEGSNRLESPRDN